MITIMVIIIKEYRHSIKSMVKVITKHVIIKHVVTKHVILVK